jgi:hypothetical protein
MQSGRAATDPSENWLLASGVFTLHIILLAKKLADVACLVSRAMNTELGPSQPCERTGLEVIEKMKVAHVTVQKETRRSSTHGRKSLTNNDLHA